MHDDLSDVFYLLVQASPRLIQDAVTLLNAHVFVHYDMYLHVVHSPNAANLQIVHFQYAGYVHDTLTDFIEYFLARCSIGHFTKCPPEHVKSHLGDKERYEKRCIGIQYVPSRIDQCAANPYENCY